MSRSSSSQGNSNTVSANERAESAVAHRLTLAQQLLLFLKSIFIPEVWARIILGRNTTASSNQREGSSRIGRLLALIGFNWVPPPTPPPSQSAASTSSSSPTTATLSEMPLAGPLVPQGASRCRTVSAPAATASPGADGSFVRTQSHGELGQCRMEAAEAPDKASAANAAVYSASGHVIGRSVSDRTGSTESDIFSGMPLANELLLHIFNFLDARTLSCYCSSVCRAWRQLALIAIKDRELAQHETFMLTHAQTHVECNSYLMLMDYHLSSASSPPFVVTGESGSGKSTVLTHWILRHCRSRADTMVLYHFIGSPAHSTDYLMILYRMMCFLRFHGGISEDVPTQRSHLIQKFPSWLSMASANRNIIIVLDGLDQLDDKDSAASLLWLPSTLPPSVKMILSTRETNSTLNSELFEKRKWKPLPLQALHVTEKERVIRRILHTRRFHVSNALIEHIIQSPQTDNPLYLTILTEHLPRIAKQRPLEEKVAIFLRAPNASSLFGQVISMLEEDFVGSTVVADFLTCLYVSRAGLSETEVEEMLNIDNQTWMRMHEALAPSLITRSGLITFLHEGLKQAVGLRYFRQPSDRILAYQKLIAYFSQKMRDGSVGQRVVDELPCLLESVNDLQQLKLCISNIRLFDRLFHKERKYDLFRYWVSTQADSSEISLLYKNSLNEYESDSQGNMKEVARLAHKIGEYIRDGGHYNEAIYFFEKALQIKRTEFGENSVEVATTMNELGRLFFRLGRNDETLYMWKRSLEIREMAKAGREDHDIAISLNNLALIYEKMGRWQEAEPTYLRALEIYKQVSGPEHPDVAITYHNLGLLYSSHSNRLKDSENMYLRALTIKEKHYGKDHNELAMTLNNLGLVYSKTNQLQKASDYYRKAIEIREAIFGSEHPDVALFLFNLGVCYGKLMNLPQAKRCLFRSLRIRRRVYGLHHQSTQVVRSWIQYFNWNEDEEA